MTPAGPLPPGQVITRKFPVTGESAPPPGLTRDDWELVIEGLVERPARLTFADLASLPDRTFVADIHCVTGWSQRVMAFTGWPLEEVLERWSRPLPEARFVRFVAYSARNHDTSLPLDFALRDCWLVHSFDGQALTPSHGYPIRVVTPSRYFYKSLKWLRRIELLAEDRLGFWERGSGYHNVGDPWEEQRFDAWRFTSKAEADAFRALTDFSEYRDQPERVIAKADLSHWRPRSLNLRGLRLKACDFRHADLRGVDFHGANLTLGKFHRADLEGADFTSADLEGANFVGAKMHGARLVDCRLSAAQFQAVDGSGLASWEDMIVVRPQGLLESQEAYLRGLGALRDQVE